MSEPKCAVAHQDTLTHDRIYQCVDTAYARRCSICTHIHILHVQGLGFRVSGVGFMLHADAAYPSISTC